MSPTTHAAPKKNTLAPTLSSPASTTDAFEFARSISRNSTSHSTSPNSTAMHTPRTQLATTGSQNAPTQKIARNAVVPPIVFSVTPYTP